LPEISVNENIIPLIEELCVKPEVYNVKILNIGGATVIDAGIKARGGYITGLIITEICMGGLGETNLTTIELEEQKICGITVYTDQPIISTLASQMAGWKIKVGEFEALGSGPARALALKPKKLYQKLNYKDTAEHAVIVLETNKIPDEEVLTYIADKCGIETESLYAILTPTTSLTCMVQVSGRIIETGIHKLLNLDFDIESIKYGWGFAPIPPPHPNFEEAMGRANDAILYGGSVNYIVEAEDKEIEKIIEEVPSSSSPAYGKPFLEIFKEAEGDFYKIDPNLFAPAEIQITNMKTGKTFKAGKIEPKILLRSFGFTE